VKDRSVREGNWRDRDDATGGLQNRETLWYPLLVRGPRRSGIRCGSGVKS